MDLKEFFTHLSLSPTTHPVDIHRNVSQFAYYQHGAVIERSVYIFNHTKLGLTVTPRASISLPSTLNVRPSKMATVTNLQLSMDFSGLEWVGDLWGSEPRWTVHLDREAIKKTVQSTISLPGLCTVKFLTQGALNKLYIVKSEKVVVIRVTLPVDPKWKTLSEVTTLKWVRTTTHLPVPKVLAYEVNRDNSIRFEYIVLRKMRCKPLADVWQKRNFKAKEVLARKLASFCAETFRHQTKGIGNFFPSPGGDMRRFGIGRIVSAAFIWDDRIHQDVFRGPFPSSKAWLSARLTLAENDCRKCLNSLKKLENPDKDKKDTVGGRDKEEKGENEDYVYLQTGDWQEAQKA